MNKKTLWYSFSLLVTLIYSCPVLPADQNSSIIPGSLFAPPSGEVYSQDYGGYSNDAPPYHYPKGFPDHQGALLWLVPVMQLLVSLSLDSTLTITPHAKLLPVFIGASMSWWFAGEQAAQVARQHGYLPSGDPAPWPCLPSPGTGPIPMLEAPTAIPSSSGVATGQNQAGTGGGEGAGNICDGDQPGGQESSDNQGRRDGDGGGQPPRGYHPSRLAELGKQILFIDKTVESNGQQYHFRAYLDNLNQQLFCIICRQLIEPQALNCDQCHYSFCLSHLENLGENPEEEVGCPSCRQTNGYIQEDYRIAINNLRWVCQQCQKFVLTTDIDRHIGHCHHFACDFAVNGCPFTGTYSQVSEHEQDCSAQPIPCQNSGCTEKVSRRDMPVHRVTCQHQPSTLPGSTVTLPRHETEQIIRTLSMLKQDGSEQAQEYLGSFNILLRSLQEGLKEATCHNPEECQGSSKRKAVECPECQQPVRDGTMSRHDCSVFYCRFCEQDWPSGSRKFHQQYCRPLWHFNGRCLTRCNQDNAYITYLSDDNQSVFILVQASTLQAQAPPAYVSITAGGNVYKIRCENKCTHCSASELTTGIKKTTTYTFTILDLSEQCLYQKKLCTFDLIITHHCIEVETYPLHEYLVLCFTFL